MISGTYARFCVLLTCVNARHPVFGGDLPKEHKVRSVENNIQAKVWLEKEDCESIWMELGSNGKVGVECIRKGKVRK